MKRIWNRAGLLLLIASASAAAAPQWESVDINRDRKVFLDRSTIVRQSGYAQGWERADFAELQPGERTGERYQSVKSLYRYDCIGRSAVPMLHVYYQSDGSELRRVDVQGLNPPRTVETDSVRAQLLERACTPVEKIQKAKADPVRKAQALPAAAKPSKAKSSDEAKPIRKAVYVKPLPKKTSKARPAPKRAQAKKAIKPKAEPDCPVAEPAAIKTALNAPRPDRTPDPDRVAHADHAAAAWSYAGLHGPEQWGKLSNEYAQCAAGRRQSPIDIRDGAKLELDGIVFDYKPSPLSILDTGHTVRVDAAPGSSITVAGTRYALKQLHFHKPAEEVVAGKTYALSAHLVHESEDHRLAVLAVLFDRGEEANAMLRSLWPHLPLERGREIAMPDFQVDWNAFLPSERGYYAYMGSLTTPPCTEGVLWLVMKTPLPISQAQVDVFGRLYPANARPLQAANGRLIKESL